MTAKSSRNRNGNKVISSISDTQWEVLGFLAGKRSLRRIVKWAKRNRQELKKLELKNGIFSLSTFSWITAGTDGKLLTLVFID